MLLQIMADSVLWSAPLAQVERRYDIDVNTSEEKKTKKKNLAQKKIQLWIYMLETM